MGDFQGHPFRGNQYTDVAAGDLQRGDKVVAGTHGGAAGTVKNVQQARAAGWKVIQFEEGHSTSLHKSAAVKVDRGEGPAKVHDPGKAEMEMERRAAQGFKAPSSGPPSLSKEQAAAEREHAAAVHAQRSPAARERIARELAAGRAELRAEGAPDLEHLAKENKIPANVGGLVDSMGRLTQAGVENAQRAWQAGTENTDKQGRMISRKSLSEERDERTARGERLNEGHGGTKTPAEEDEVMIKGNVSGAGKRGVVSSISPSGSYMDVVDPRTGKHLGSFHSSNLQVRGERRARRRG